MQVTHVQDHVTHAVIAPALAIDFGISDSPEFFNILSSTLYSDQILAVVRETLCNEWDAHIEAKCEDRAVEITLTDKEFIIRDFGPGIPKHMIGPIYGMYGGSTKVANGKVTGGFGLGCKSPFAYVDDFEVTSYCEGERTIYRLSKSNAETGGKPSIIPVVTTPTTESGLQVKLALKNPSDRRRFDQLIRRIVQNGAMNMKLNGDQLPSLPFDDMKNGFMLTKKQVLENHQPIVIRYGNVIYPIESDPAYAVEWSEIVNFIRRVAVGDNRYSNSDHGWTLVLQAAPNTVSVTPSRESLSLQKHTIATIKQLMEGFLTARDKELTVECFKLLEDRINKVWLESAPAVLFDTDKKIPNMSRRPRLGSGRHYSHHSTDQFIFKDDENLTTFPQFVRQYANTGYPDFKNFRKRDIVARINALIQSGFNGQGAQKMLKSYRRAYLQSLHRSVDFNWGRKKTKEFPWFHQHVVGPLARLMTKESGMKLGKLFVYRGGAHNSFRHDREKMVLATAYAPAPIEHMLPFLRNIVILSFNRMDVVDGSADDMPISKYWLGETENSLVYVVPRADDKVQRARDFFTAAGVNLIDLTVEQKREYVAKEAQAIIANVPKKPKKTGIPKLSAMVNDKGNFFNRAMEYSDDIERTASPLFVIKDGRRNEYTEIEGVTKAMSEDIVQIYGAVGAICVNQNQYDRYIGAGAIDWKDYILNNLVEEFSTNPRIREFLPFDATRIDYNSYNSDYRRTPASTWIDVIRKDRDLFEYFGLVNNLTDDDKKLLRIWKHFKDSWWRGDAEQAKKIEEIIKALPLNPVVKKLMDTLRYSKMLRIMDESGMAAVLLHAEANNILPQHTNLARELLLQAIEG